MVLAVTSRKRFNRDGKKPKCKMNIKLVQTGGLLPVKKEASADVDWSDEDLKGILSEITMEKPEKTLVRDGIGYILEVNGKETSIDMAKIPKNHLPVFNELKKKLTIMRF